MSNPAMVVAPESHPLPGSEGAARGRWLPVIGLCLLFVALRWRAYNAPLIRDEGEYAYAARLLAAGLPPYEYCFLQKPPMIVYTYALADVITPGIFWFPRVLAYLSAAVATVLVGYIARLEFGRECMWTAVFVFTPMVLLPRLEQAIANTEMFMLVPLLGVAALFVRARHAASTRGLWFGAGVLAAVALGYKYTAAPLLAAVFAAWSLQELRVGGAKAVGKSWLWGLLGVLGGSVAVLGYFLVHDGGRHLWECTIAFNRAYAASGTFALGQLWSRLRQFWIEWWILFLVLPALWLKPTLRTSSAPAKDELPSTETDEAGTLGPALAESESGPAPKAWPTVLWILLFLAAWVSTGASYYWQYYVVVMPFWALLTAVALHRISGWVAARFAWPESRWRFILTAVVVVMLCLPDLSRVVPSAQQRANEQFDPLNPFPESRLVAERLAEITSPQDYVFVAGSEPQILCYARRFSPTRFIITYPLMIASPLAEGYQQEAIRDLERHPPAAIVWSRWRTSWLRKPGSPTAITDYLDTLLAAHYERVGGYVLGEHSGRWVEPLPAKDMANASLVLFHRKPDNS